MSDTFQKATKQDATKQDASKTEAIDMDGRKRIAVIGVHGVGDHPPFDTARELGNLLCDRQFENGNPRYTPFNEQFQRINVRRVNSGAEVSTGPEKVGSWGPLDRIAQAAYKPKERSRILDEVRDHLDREFMRGQLSKYPGGKPEDTYQTLRLEGGRLTEQGADERLVHVYEMFWSDLSGVGNAALRILEELYQLLFHLTAVGANNVKAASIYFQSCDHEPARKAWQRYDWWQTRAAAILAWPIPILGLFMAALVPAIVAVSMMKSHLSAVQEVWSLLTVFVLAMVTGVGIWLLRKPKVPDGFYRLPQVAALLLILATAFGIYLLNCDLEANREVIEAIAAVVFVVVGFGVVFLLLSRYESRRPGSLRAGVFALGVYVVVCLASLPGLHNWQLPYLTLRTLFASIEVAFILLLASWWGFYLFCGAAHLAGDSAIRSIASLRSVDSEKVDAARRTRWTARLTLALSSVVFTVLTLALWSGLVKVGIPVLPGQDRVPFSRTDKVSCAPKDAAPATCIAPAIQPKQPNPVMYESIMRRILRDNRDPDFASRWVDETIFVGGLASLPFLLVALLLSLLMAAWAISPSVWNEFVSPQTGPGAKKPQIEPNSLGNWLSSGFRYLRGAGWILYLVTLAGAFAPIFFFFVRDWLLRGYLDSDPRVDAVDQFTRIIGTLIAGTAAGLIGFAGRISKLTGGLRTAVRVGLDVDNWLREHPLDSNPTARICGRYVSLLRHILSWKEGGSPTRKYDAIVIVAHSQGTVITADLLRFLKAERAKYAEDWDPELEPLLSGAVPVYYFSMGSPLRQLYGLRFPFLYGWARDNGGPEPKDLGVREWINAYRSGDYVGRCLWPKSADCDHWNPKLWQPGEPCPDLPPWPILDPKVEFCIGSGAHTHYWDSSAVRIAEVLDALIAKVPDAPT